MVNSRETAVILVGGCAVFYHKRRKPVAFVRLIDLKKFENQNEYYSQILFISGSKFFQNQVRQLPLSIIYFANNFVLDETVPRPSELILQELRDLRTNP